MHSSNKNKNKNLLFVHAVFAFMHKQAVNQFVMQTGIYKEFNINVINSSKELQHLRWLLKGYKIRLLPQNLLINKILHLPFHSDESDHQARLLHIDVSKKIPELSCILNQISELHDALSLKIN